MREDRYDKFENLSPELVAELKAEEAVFKAEADRMRREMAKKIADRFAYDFVLLVRKDTGGRIIPDSQYFIDKWVDGHGNTVYDQRLAKKARLNSDQLKDLSERIQVQQAAFNNLDPSEQIRIRTDFTSPGNRPDNRFSDYLSNEALATQFQKLK